jgi:hypothetical protein
MALALASGGAFDASRAQGGAASDGPLSFEGRWSAVGRRQTLPTEADRAASIVELSGAIVLSSGTGLSRGFRGEVIAFDDGRSVSAGRAVWTDERGDRVFSVLKGGVPQARRQIFGTITGGTGRYAGLTGEYEFTWQYLTEAEGDAVQGRAADLKGTFQRGGAQR